MKVPQHVQDAECADETKAPVTTQKCEIKKETPIPKQQQSLEKKESSNETTAPDNNTKTGEETNKKSGLNAIIGNVVNLTKTRTGKIASFALAISVFGIIAFEMIFKKIKNNNH